MANLQACLGLRWGQETARSASFNVSLQRTLSTLSALIAIKQNTFEQERREPIPTLRTTFHISSY
jgi:hypothetical protein